MASPDSALQNANRATLRAYVEYLANEYAPALFGKQTGVFAIVEDENGVRRPVTLNSGFRSESSPHVGDNLIQQGPFEAFRDGERITYVKTAKGVRIEYKPGAITRVVAADGTEIPFDRTLKPNEFGEITLPESEYHPKITIGPNEQHAEMRLADWASRTKHRILAMAPTRGCCAD